LKGVKTFRPDIWLDEDISKWATLHQLTVPATGEFCFSKALHGMVRDLKQKAIEYDKVAKDINVYRGYAEKLAKETKPFRCTILGEDMDVLGCYQCQSRAKEAPAQTPQTVKDCPRMKVLT
jgi:hypothetical protein